MIYINIFDDMIIAKPVIVNGETTNYFVFSNGDIFSTTTNRVLTGKHDISGYRAYSIVCADKVKVIKGHRLVANAFIPNPENKPTINHINCIRDDNRIQNLEWATQKEQMAHMIKLGRFPCQIGSHNHGSKYTESQMEMACKLMCTDMSDKEIEKVVGLTRGYCSLLRKGKAWRHVTSNYVICR